jgi:hypothetical protein
MMDSDKEVLLAAAAGLPLRPLLEGIGDARWGVLLQKAEHHRVAALLVDSAMEENLVPSLSSRLCRTLRRAARMDDRIRRNAFAHLLEQFAQRDIVAVCVKGAWLSRAVYDRPCTARITTSIFWSAGSEGSSR